MHLPSGGFPLFFWCGGETHPGEKASWKGTSETSKAMRGHGIRELFLPHFLCSIGPFLLYPIFFFLLAAPDEVPQSQGPATGGLSRIFRAYPAQHSRGHRKINRPQFRDGLKESVDRWLRIWQAPRVPTMTSCSSFGP